jgi:hypothetical protein
VGELGPPQQSKNTVKSGHEFRKKDKKSTD